MLGRRNPRSVNLDRVRLSSEMQTILHEYTKIYGETDRNFLRSSDYKRWSYVLNRMDGGGRLLDVGIGVGQFAYAADLSPKFSEVVGVDIRTHSGLLTISDRVRLVWTNAADMPFDDGEFESVTCMECLEHMDDATFTSALRELRRVVGRELMMTVPFEEPEPLPKGHVQRFSRQRIAETFPDAEVTLLSRRYSRVPWALIRETTDS